MHTRGVACLLGVFGGTLLALFGLTAQLHAQTPAGSLPPNPSEPGPETEQLTPNMVSVEAGATCLQQARLIDRISRWRQRAALDPSIRVRVRGDAASATRVFFSVTRGNAPPSERVLDDAPDDCDQLHSAVALSIALAIDAMLSGDRGSLPPAAAPPAAPSSRAPPPRAAGARHMHGELALLAGASVGVVSGPAIAGLPRLQFTPVPWLALSLVGLATREERATIEGVSGEFSATVLAGGADLCAGGETAERLTFFMCAGGRAGAFITDGTGYRVTLPWWAVSASGQARAWIVPAVAIGISVEALFVLATRDLQFVGTSPDAPAITRSIPRVGLSVAAGPVFRFF